MIKNISNLGDAALYCDFGDEVNKEINSDVIKYFNSIKENKIKGVNNLTPSYNKLIISYDLKVTNFRKLNKKLKNLARVKTQKQKVKI
jgi:allophanate hydrolase subunit 1